MRDSRTGESPTSVGPPGACEGSTPAVPSFRTLDFQRLWAGRERVTEVERELLRTMLPRETRRRVLELGCGEGRLSLVAQEQTGEYVAADVTPEFLARVPIRDGVTALRVVANLYHLPFVEGAFSAVVLVRVYGFLEDPTAGLREIRRVLAPGGCAVVSHNPRPSVATLVDDLKVATRRRRGEAMRSMTFSRAPVVSVRPSEFPAWSSTRRRFEETVRAAGLFWKGEFPTGLEEYRGLRRLPPRLFVNLARTYRGLGGFPSRFAVVARPGAPTEALPLWGAILACPACRTQLPEPRGTPPVALLSCRACGRDWRLSDGVLDARFGGIAASDRVVPVG